MPAPNVGTGVTTAVGTAMASRLQASARDYHSESTCRRTRTQGTSTGAYLMIYIRHIIISGILGHHVHGELRIFIYMVINAHQIPPKSHPNPTPEIHNIVKAQQSQIWLKIPWISIKFNFFPPSLSKSSGFLHVSHCGLHCFDQLQQDSH